MANRVIGRALRRVSYQLNEHDRFDVEYADIFGIPFDFTAQAVVAPIKPPPPTVRVHAISPERDEAEIRFPRVWKAIAPNCRATRSPRHSPRTARSN